MSEERVEVIPVEFAAPPEKRPRGRPRLLPAKTRKKRDWRGESAYQRWLLDPPEHQRAQSAEAVKLLAALRARAKEAGFKAHGGRGGSGGVTWSALSKEVGLQRVQLALMLGGKQRVPLHIIVQVAHALGMKLQLVEDDV